MELIVMSLIEIEIKPALKKAAKTPYILYIENNKPEKAVDTIKQNVGNKKQNKCPRNVKNVRNHSE